jgi:hypothetical protein
MATALAMGFSWAEKLSLNPDIGEEFMHVQNRCPEAVAVLQDLAIGLHRVAATGGCYQHGIELSFDRVHAVNKVLKPVGG